MKWFVKIKYDGFENDILGPFDNLDDARITINTMLAEIAFFGTNILFASRSINEIFIYKARY